MGGSASGGHDPSSKYHDSETEEQVTPHTVFTHANIPADALYRKFIEARGLVFASEYQLRSAVQPEGLG